MRSEKAPADLGAFHAQAEIVNDSDAEKTVDVTVSIDGDNAPSPVTKQVKIGAGSTYTFDEACKVENPTLWEGARYDRDSDSKNVGYRYTVTLTIRENGETIDQVSDKIGFRYFWIDTKDNGEKGEGFYLNGKKFPLRGVNRHSFLAKVGSAMTESDHAKDMEIMKELGVNTVRLCHYPQTDYFYDLCDENGIIVWTEIPVVNEIRDTDEFRNITKQQLTELISEQYNRPSVVFWGIENEIGNGQSLTNAKANANLATAKKLLYDLDALAKKLDPTGRYTTQAVNRDYSMNQNDPDSVNRDFENNTGWKSDVVAWNIYPGWYPDANFYGTFEDVMVRKGAMDSRAMGISEYGWGANVSQHEAYPELGVNGLSSGGKWHPEEYQNLMNEEAVAYLNTHDELWGTFYWALFDFAVDSRNEGGQIARNDKGLVTADRQTKKDSFYLYKANWNKKDRFTYITSRRWTEREDASTYIKVYSNCDEVELFMNGKSLGKMDAKGNGVFRMDSVNLAVGNVKIEAVGTCKEDANEYKDSCQWTRELCTKPDLSSKVYPVDTVSKTVIVENDVTLKEFKQAVTGVNQAAYKVYDGEKEITDDNMAVVPGMRIHVVAEDGRTEADYTVVSSNLCVGKKVTASSTETGNEPEHAVDGNGESKWVASGGSYPQELTIDLEKNYYLGDVTIDWDYRNGARYYGYTISVSEDGKNFTQIVDQKNNKNSKSNKDSMKLSRGRYLKITTTGCNQVGWASIFEVKADGYQITSDQYTIDDKHQLVIVDEFPQTGLAEGTFSDHLDITGNYDHRVNLSSGWIKEGNTIDILDAEGKTVTTWTICSKENAGDYYKEVQAEQIALNVTEKNLAVNGTLQLKTTILPLTASDQSVKYTTSDKAVATVSDSGLVTAHKLGSTTITASTSNGKTASCVIRVKDFSNIHPAAELSFEKEDEVQLYKDAKLTQDPDNKDNQVLLVDPSAGGMNGNYAIAKTDLSKMDFSKGVTVSLKVRPTANSSDWNYLFAIGQTISSGSYNYCDGTIGFIARHGDPYEAHFPGDGWSEGNNVESSYSYFQTQDHADKWYRLTYVYSPSETCIYVDGVQVCRFAESSSIRETLKNLNKGHLVLGAGASEGTLENFGGYIDDVYLYEEALDADSIPYIGKTQTAPGADDSTDPEPSAKPQPSEKPQAAVSPAQKKKNSQALDSGLKIHQTGKKLKTKWGKVKDADGYLLNISYADSKKAYTPVLAAKASNVTKTIQKIAGKKINNRKVLKVKVSAYINTTDGRKIIGSSRTCYVAGANSKYTNVKQLKVKKSSCSIRKGKSEKLTVSLKKQSQKKKLLPKKYGKTVSFQSSDPAVASVSGSGLIKAKKKGKCEICIYTQSGLAKNVKVVVK